MKKKSAVLEATSAQLSWGLGWALQKEEESAVLEATLAQLKLSWVKFELELG